MNMNKLERLKVSLTKMIRSNKSITYKEILNNKDLLLSYSGPKTLRKRLGELKVRELTFPTDVINFMKNKNVNIIKDEKLEDDVTKEFNKKEVLDMFKKQYHKKTINLEKVKTGIDKYLKKRGWIPDTEFKQLCGVSSVEWKYIREKFSEIQITVDKQIIWGHKDIIKDMKKIIENNAAIY